MEIAHPADVHQFWFGELDAQGIARDSQRRSWFLRNDDFDRAIATQFAQTVAAAERGELDHWCKIPKDWVCYLIVCDQFPRNLRRGNAAAFALDSRARQAARDGLHAQHHRQLGLDEQSFCFMPFMHSEDLLDQYLAVGLFTTLRDHATDKGRSYAGNSLRHAQQHRDTILQFGRFPYRNAALGRTSTQAERDSI
ncbi:MAG: DUF924 family protein [Pseudomonadales bacterium]